MVRKDNNIKKNMASPPKNKNDIPVFSSSEDLFSLFMGDNGHDKKRGAPFSKRQFSEDKSQDSSETIAQEQNHGQNHYRKKDKHGIHILDHSGSLPEIFLQDNENNDNGNFSDLIDSALKGKSYQALMREKRDKPSPSPVPLKKRLKRYPPPQKLLDLHGDTASMAEIKADSYIRTCRRNGVFTLRIVVGKGLHSAYGAVLPDVIEDLLIKLKKEGVVLWFQWDRKKKSASGALIVYLKQFKD